MFERKQGKILRGFYMRPILPFVLQFALLAPLTLAADLPAMTSLYVLISPWLVAILAVINLPILFLAFDSFKLDIAKRRNHALEHATVLLLRASGHKRVAGQARSNGFRVSGGPSKKEIRAEFDTVQRQVSEGIPLVYVSSRCGSNRIMALAFGLLLLFSVTVLSALFRPSLLVRAAALIAVMIAFTVLRHPTGNWFQKHLFMATDFRKVKLRAVRKVKTRIWDKSPTYFVETLINTP